MEENHTNTYDTLLKLRQALRAMFLTLGFTLMLLGVLQAANQVSDRRFIEGQRQQANAAYVLPENELHADSGRGFEQTESLINHTADTDVVEPGIYASEQVSEMNSQSSAQPITNPQPLDPTDNGKEKAKNEIAKKAEVELPVPDVSPRFEHIPRQYRL